MEKLTILCVDDEHINLMLLQATLEEKFNVITAISGIKGLEMIAENSNINAIISDMKMPEMSGLEFIQEAKKTLPDIPYFMLSGYDVTPEVRAALNSKIITQYFCKPLNLTELETILEKQLS